MNGRASRRKGHDFERKMVRAHRKIFGDDVRRGFQTRSGEEEADVVVPVFWIECKKGKKPNIKAALEQAEEACSKGKVPVAITKQDRCKAIVSLRLDDWLEFLEEWWRARDR